MQRYLKTLMLGLSAAGLGVFTAQLSLAQIAQHVKADVTHDFTIANTTLPPGHYMFSIVPKSDNEVMNIKAADGDLSENFLVRRARTSTAPDHAELIFDRYGDNEQFLSKIFVPGSKVGFAVVEPSRREAILDHQGQHYTENTETESE